MDFPQSVSLTITNACNLRCGMCGQWSDEGYMHDRKESLKQEMALADWKRIVDEVAAHGLPALFLRGGEPFLFPDIVALLEYVNSKGIFVSIDTNGTMLETYAQEIVRIGGTRIGGTRTGGTRIGGIHLTISVDGPEEIHDRVRGVPGCFERIRRGLARLNEVEKESGRTISKSINFTISPDAYEGLGAMPDVARDLSIGVISLVPYYYFPTHVGKRYEDEMRDNLNCAAFSWRGFHRETSEVDLAVFRDEFRKFRANLDGVYSYPYMDLSEEEYRVWFEDPVAPVGPLGCTNVEKLVDVQPQGDVNFCVDFPDYAIGNVREATIAEIWDGERAARFREYRRKQPLAVCYRCGAKYMSEVGG
jgi:MoaA/NifB/PqqE/SkfB family radical SAM enzyme